MCVLHKFINSACGLRSYIVYRSPVWILNLFMPSFWRSSHHSWNFYSNKISSFQWPPCHYFSSVSWLNLMANRVSLFFSFFSSKQKALQLCKGDWAFKKESWRKKVQTDVRSKMLNWYSLRLIFFLFVAVQDCLVTSQEINHWLF